MEPFCRDLVHFFSCSDRVCTTKKSQYIAVVDDEESVSRALKRLLQSGGFEVETFASGAAFLESLNHRVPACVVLDHHMPEMTGLDVQSRLSELLEDLSVIFITGHDSSELRQRALEKGASAYLRKPVDEHELFDAVRRSVVGG